MHMTLVLHLFCMPVSNRLYAICALSGLFHLAEVIKRRKVGLGSPVRFPCNPPLEGAEAKARSGKARFAMPCFWKGRTGTLH